MQSLCNHGHRGEGSSILPHTHDIDDSTPIITGAGIPAEYTAPIFATFDQGLMKCVHSTHHAHICKFIEFILEKYGDISKMFTCIISPEDRAKLELYYTDQDIKDLTFSGLDTDCFLAFLLMLKTTNGILSSYSHMSQVYDAIMYGL